jgi:hypothetical protein
VVLYLSDMGRRRGGLPRPRRDIVRDADAALAIAIDSGHDDLVAELLWTWPMLGLPWSPTADFCFDLLTERQDRLDFLPGPEYSKATHLGLPTHDRAEYVIRTSYHPALAMGLLCAAALGLEQVPPAPNPTNKRPRGAAQELFRALPAGGSEWENYFRELDRSRQDALAPFLLTVGLRRARERSDLLALRQLLDTALRLGETATPAVAQAAGLLRRVAVLAGSTDLTRTG